MAASFNYYDFLGVPRTATRGEIKKAWRKIVEENHPDRNPGDKAAEEKTKNANEAWSVLGRKESRDRYNTETAYSDPAPPPPADDPFDAGTTPPPPPPTGGEDPADRMYPDDEPIRMEEDVKPKSTSKKGLFLKVAAGAAAGLAGLALVGTLASRFMSSSNQATPANNPAPSTSAPANNPAPSTSAPDPSPVVVRTPFSFQDSVVIISDPATHRAKSVSIPMAYLRSKSKLERAQSLRRFARLSLEEHELEYDPADYISGVTDYQPFVIPTRILLNPAALEAIDAAYLSAEKHLNDQPQKKRLAYYMRTSGPEKVGAQEMQSFVLLYDSEADNYAVEVLNEKFVIAQDVPAGALQPDP